MKKLNFRHFYLEIEEINQENFPYLVKCIEKPLTGVGDVIGQFEITSEAFMYITYIESVSISPILKKILEPVSIKESSKIISNNSDLLEYREQVFIKYFLNLYSFFNERNNISKNFNNLTDITRQFINKNLYTLAVGAKDLEKNYIQKAGESIEYKYISSLIIELFKK